MLEEQRSGVGEDGLGLLLQLRLRRHGQRSGWATWVESVVCRIRFTSTAEASRKACATGG